MSETSGVFQIDCGSCVMQNTDLCEGCVVTAILDRPEGAVVFDVAVERALRTLGEAGLLPGVRYERRTEVS